MALLTCYVYIEKKHEFLATRVKRGASIGANATIICGCTIGSYCMIGAGAVVTKDVPDYALLVGNPAKLIGFVCYCGETLKTTGSMKAGSSVTCNTCSRNYEKHGLTLTLLDS